MKTASRRLSIIALALCWLGYFSPWLWPPPAALRLSARDLVEWMTFMQTVRDGTFPVTRLDLLWPLAGIAILTALLTAQVFEPQRRKERPGNTRMKYSAFAVNHWPELVSTLFALFAAGLILPPYEFLRIAYNDPELAPQFWLGVVTGIAAPFLTLFAALRPAWARCCIPLVAAFGLLASVRAFAVIQPPFVDILTQAAPLGYGFMLIALGFSALVILPAIGLVFATIPRLGRSTKTNLSN